MALISVIPLLKFVIMGNWMDVAQSAASSAASSAGSGLLGLMFGGITAKRQMRNQKKLMALANEYEIAAFNRENARQDYLMHNEDSIKKSSLARAGYSTADPQGTGVSTPAVNSQGAPASPTAPMPFASTPMDFASSYNQIAQAKKTASETRLNEIQEKYQAALYEGQIGKMNAEIKQIQDLLPERLNEIRANVDSLVSQKAVNEKQAEKIVQETDNLKEIVKGIEIDNRYKAAINEQTKQKLINEVSLLSKEGRIKEAEAKLADMGIVLSHSGMAAIVSAALNGKINDIASQLGDSIVKLTEGLPDIVRNVMSAIYKALSDAGADVLNKIKNLF